MKRTHLIIVFFLTLILCLVGGSSNAVALDAPVITSPTNDATYPLADQVCQIYWTPVTGATVYCYALWDITDGTEIVLTGDYLGRTLTYGGTNYVPASLVAENHRYKMVVRAIDRSVSPSVVTTSEPVYFNVTTREYNSEITNCTIPATMDAGYTYNVSITFKNTGSKTWTEDNLDRLVFSGDYNKFGIFSDRMALASGETIPSGASKTWNFSMTPDSSGEYYIKIRMYHNDITKFGAYETYTIISNPSDKLPYDAKIISTNIPTDMKVGRSYTASITVQNTGTYAWTGANIFSFCPTTDNTCPNMVTQWINNEVVAVGGTKTFTMTIKCDTAQYYGFGWQMSHNGTAFGEEFYDSFRITNVLAASLSLDTNGCNMTLDDEPLPLTATLLPADTTNKEIEWDSSNTSIATVSYNGFNAVVTPVGIGHASIRVMWLPNTDIYDTCSIDVLGNVDVTGISLNKSKLVMQATDVPVQLIATVTPSDAINKGVTWTSSNPEIATVSDLGLVTPNRNGYTTIKAASKAKPGIYATCTVIIGTEDVSGPDVIGTSPFDGQTDVAISQQTVIVNFDESVKAGPNYDNIQIICTTYNNAVVPISSKSISSYQLTITRSGDWSTSNTYRVTIPAGALQDDAGNSTTSDIVFTFSTGTGTPVATVPTVITQAATNVGESSATLNGAVDQNGGATITEYGFWYDVYGKGNYIQFKFTGSINTDVTFSKTITGLASGTKYSYYAYAINSKGESIHSSEYFTTVAGATVPTIITQAATIVGETSATLNGVVDQNGGATITEYGFWYGVFGTGKYIQVKFTGSINTDVTFSKTITGLASGTKYSYYAYAINSNGESIHSSEYFTTLAASTVPKVITQAATNVGETSATLNGVVDQNGGSTITEYGFWYDVYGTGKYIQVKFTGSINTDVTFNKTITGLDSGTKYSYYAYAINSKGESIHSSEYFTTVAVPGSFTITAPSGNITVGTHTITAEVTGMTMDHIYAAVTNPNGIVFSLPVKPGNNYSTTYNFSARGTYSIIAYGRTTAGVVKCSLPVKVTTYTDGTLVITAPATFNLGTPAVKVVATGITLDHIRVNVLDENSQKVWSESKLGNTWEAKVPFTSSGNYTIEANGYTAGNAFELPATPVTVHAGGPVTVDITSPTDGTTVCAGDVTVYATGTNCNHIYVAAINSNGVEVASQSKDGNSFTGTLNINTPGSYQLVATGCDKISKSITGAKSNQDTHILKVIPVPSVKITSPTKTYFDVGEPITFKADLTNCHHFTAMLNGNALESYQVCPTSYTYSYSITSAKAGTYTFSIAGRNTSTENDPGTKVVSQSICISVGTVEDIAAITVPHDYQYFVIGDEETKKPIVGASVTLGGTNTTTDVNGLAKFKVNAAGVQTVTISAGGYCKYGTDYSVAPGSGFPFYIKKDTDPTKPSIYFMTLNDGTKVSNILIADKAYNEITVGTTPTTKDYCNIVIKADWKGKTPYKYILAQNGSPVLENTTGQFDKIALGQEFEPDAKIYAIVKASDGTSSRPVETKIHIINNPWQGNEKGEIKIGDKVSVTVPSNLPIIGGMELNMGLSFVPATVCIKKDSFKIVFGRENMLDDPANWATVKSKVEEARKAINRTNALAAFGGKSSYLSICSGWDSEYGVMGYAEGVIKNGQFIPTNGGLIIKADSTYNIKNQYVVGPVPVYLELGGGFGIDINTDFAGLIPETGELKLKADLKITPHFKLGGGVGIVGVVTVGASGDVDLEFLIRFADDYNKVSLTGKMSLKATALFFEAKKEIAKGTWVIAEGYGNVSQSAITPYSTVENSLYDDSQYSLMPRDYAQRPSVWTGDAHAMNIMNYNNKEVKTLQTNIFPNAQPQLAVIGDNQVMAWVADDITRADANRTMLVYSIYDKTTDTWCVPTAVNDDGTADFYPQLASDGNNLFAVWQNSKTTFANTVNMTEVAMAGEIAVAKFNTSSNTFEDPTILTNNTTLDTQPQIAVNNNQVFVVWTNNDQNDIFGITGQNSICYSTYSETWSVPQVLASNLNVIPTLSVGCINNEYITSYVVDSDNDLNTIDDRDIYTIKAGQEAAKFADNTTMDSSPIFADFNGTKTLYWYNDGNIMYQPGLSGATSQVFSQSKPGFRDDFKIVNNLEGRTAAIWTETNEESVDIRAAIYDPSKGVWSEDVNISNLGSKVQFPNGVFDENGNFNIAFNKLTQLDESTSQSDLCVLKVTPAYNLAVNYVNFDPTKVIPGSQMPLEIEVTNNGELAVDQIKVDVLDGTNINNSMIISNTVLPGETKTVNATLNLPSVIAKTIYTVSATPVPCDEYDLTDNSQEITLGYTDLSLQLDKYEVCNNAVITAQISNNSYVPTDATIIVSEDGIDGNVIFANKVTNVVYGTNSFLTFNIDPNNLNFTDDSKQLYFKVQADAEEFSTGDNADFIVLNKIAPMELQSIEITQPAAKLIYNVGDPLDLTGLEVTGTYSDSSIQIETITADNITGFDSSAAKTDQVLTITVSGKTTTYNVQILSAKAVIGVSLDNHNLTLIAGGSTGTLTAIISPEDANNMNIAWSSSDEAVATVVDGVVTPLAVGTADITVTTADGSFTDFCTVTVIPASQDECFIATAAFGSKFTWPVTLLRHFRDQFLLTNTLGTAFVDFYYRNSPPIAAIIAHNQGLRLLVRILLAPIIAMVYVVYHPLLMGTVVVLLIIFFFYRSRLRRRFIRA